MDLMRKMGWSQRIGYFGAIFDSAVHTNATAIGSPSLVYKLDNNGYMDLIVEFLMMLVLMV